ncbi:solute carrier family 22 member 18 isoform X11 [Tursiops truncatus]|uniref:solute carrier family 22 member 18 isoform X11 n=1 Tax=Tursiops truncatus TaxID=9739 RepID=UPI003CCFCBBD
MRVRRPGGGGGQPPGRGGGGGEFIPGGWVSQVPRRGRVPEPCPGWARPELTQEGSPHQDGAQADPYEASCSDPYGVSQQRLPRMREVRASRGQGRSPSRTGTLDLSRVMLLVYVLAALELACLFMQFSVMPYLSRRLGLDSVAFGYQQTIFGVLQLLGGPVFGRFADQRGARAAFTLSFLASSALYLLLAAACSPALPGVPLLFASRLPGALMHTLPAAQMAITDLSAPEERPAALGRLGLCFGVGVIFGSLLGGTLSSTCGIQCPVIVAFVVSLLGAVLSLTCIPTSTKGASARAQAALPGKPKASVFDLKAITCLLLQPGVLPVFLVKVICGFPSAGGRPGRLPHVLLRGPPDGASQCCSGENSWQEWFLLWTQHPGSCRPPSRGTAPPQSDPCHPVRRPVMVPAPHQGAASGIHAEPEETPTPDSSSHQADETGPQTSGWGHLSSHPAGPCCAACGILVPQPGIEPVPPAAEAQSLNHWTAREVPVMCIVIKFFTTLNIYQNSYQLLT